MSAANLAARVRHGFESFVRAEAFSCLGARAALRHDGYRLQIFAPLASREATEDLSRELGGWLADSASRDDFSTFVAVFLGPAPESEAQFEARLWEQLQHLHRADAAAGWDPDVSSDPDDSRFSFSFGGRGLFVVGMHPMSSRAARRFGWPALAFNPHEQFERLRTDDRYGRLQRIIRARELKAQGSLNPNLAEFGELSEARQYSGRAAGPGWRCPFHPTRS